MPLDFVPNSIGLGSVSVNTPLDDSFPVSFKFNGTFLPPAYVVRREGNSFTLFVCPHLGGGTHIP